MGAFLGGVIVGGINSWLASPDQVSTVKNPKGIPYPDVALICKNIVEEDLDLNEEILKSISSSVKEKIYLEDNLEKSVLLDSFQLSVGKTHNVILSVLDNSMILDKNKEIIAADGLYNSFLDSSEFESMCTNMIYDMYTGNYQEKDPLLNRLWNLFEKVFMEYTAGSSDIVKIINKYVKVIDRTDELTNEEKESLKYSFATALYSFNYWSKTIEKKYEKNLFIRDSLLSLKVDAVYCRAASYVNPV